MPLSKKAHLGYLDRTSQQWTISTTPTRRITLVRHAW